MITLSMVMIVVGLAGLITLTLVYSMIYDDHYTTFNEWFKVCIYKELNLFFIIIFLIGIAGYNYFENKNFNDVDTHNNICEIGTVNYFEINALEIEREIFYLDETYFIPNENDTVKIGDVVEFCYKVPNRGKFLTSLSVVEIKE